MNDKKLRFLLGGKFLSTLIVVLIGIAFYQALSHFDVIRHSLSDILDVVSPFLAGIVIAYLLNSPTRFFERTLFSKLRCRRTLSILTTYLLTLAAAAILLTLVLPQIGQSLSGLVNNLNKYLDNFNDLLYHFTDVLELDTALEDKLLTASQDLVNSVADLLSSLVTTHLPKLLNYGVAIGSGLVSGITAVISSVYLLAGKERLIIQVRKSLYAVFPKEKTDWFLGVCARANEIFSGFVMGKLLDSLIIGILCFFLCILLRIPLPLLIGVIIGFTNIIPFFGPIVGAAPCALILLIIDPWSCLRFLILILVLQQFDGNILGPRILGNSTGLSPIWVLVSIVVGGGLFGFPGMVLGVPTFAVIYTLARDWINRRLKEKGLSPTDPS